MKRSALALSALCLVTACGRFGFLSLGDDGPSDARMVDAPDGAEDRPNRAFVTADVYAADFGGIASADTKCAMEAAAAGYSGHFIALLSTTTIDARDRLAGSRGWVRSDGLPLADRADDFFLDGHVLAPLNLAPGATTPPPYSDVWTASGPDGLYDATNGSCGDWTSQAGSALVGFHDRNPPFMVSTAIYPCMEAAHLYCLEIGHAVPVTPLVGSGRIAFISTAVAADVGLSGFDAQCAADATAASLPPGTYLAAVSTSTQTAASRFNTTMPWHRVDGMPVSTSGDAMFDGTQLIAFLDQRADGSRITDSTFTTPLWTGGLPELLATSSCSDWATAAPAAMGEGGGLNSVDYGAFWSGAPHLCNEVLPVVCLQQ